MPRGRFNAPRDPATGRYVPAVSPSQFSRELMEKAEYTPHGLKDVVEDSCKRVEATAKLNVRRSAPIHNAGAWRGIDYEVNEDRNDVWGEVGYNPKVWRPAFLGNLLEYGGGGDPSPPHWDIARALNDEQEEFARNVKEYGGALLESRWSVME